MIFDKNWKHALTATALLVLGGCGGSNDPIVVNGGTGTSGGSASGGSTSNTGGTVPASAFASIDAFYAYVQSIVASNSDTALPLAITDGTSAPVSDTAAAKNF